jgi:hypothetical protein
MPQIPSGFGQNRGILFFAENRRAVLLYRSILGLFSAVAV